MRILSGVLFGLGTVWFIFPYLAVGFGDLRRDLEIKLSRAGALEGGTTQ
jgi:hypothetical protein